MDVRQAFSLSGKLKGLPHNAQKEIMDEIFPLNNGATMQNGCRTSFQLSGQAKSLPHMPKKKLWMRYFL